LLIYLEILISLSEEKQLEMLDATFRFIAVKELRSIPIGILKRLKTIPTRYLKALTSKKISFVIEVIMSKLSKYLENNYLFVGITVSYSKEYMAIRHLIVS
jgi:hypothetical protein